METSEIEKDKTKFILEKISIDLRNYKNDFIHLDEIELTEKELRRFKTKLSEKLEIPLERIKFNYREKEPTICSCDGKEFKVDDLEQFSIWFKGNYRSINTYWSESEECPDIEQLDSTWLQIVMTKYENRVRI